MHSWSPRVSRTFVLLALPCSLGFAAWEAGCADDTNPAAATPTPTPDAGEDSSFTIVDSGGNADSGKRDCSADLDADGLWKHLDCSGLYSSFAEKTIAPDVKPYKPAVEFWSDGAEKSRWVSIPAGQKIDISDWDEWSYPVGTKLWKEFKLGGKRVETRLFTKLPDQSWAHTVYRWTDDQSDAVRKDGGEIIPGLGPDGGPYEIPNSGACDQCHHGRKDQVLGFDAVSLGQDSATGETLAKLAADGLLSQTPPSTALTMPGAAEAKAAVSWVNINCGACHNANANASAAFRKHFLVRASDLASPDGGAGVPLEQLDIWTQGYCVDTVRNDPDAGAPFKYIRGGSPDRSLMAILASSRTPPDVLPNAGVQMPPIVTRAVDHAGVKLLDDWIATLPACP